MVTMAVVSCPVVTSIPAPFSRIEKRASLPSNCSFQLNCRVHPSLCGRALGTSCYRLALRRCGFVAACLPSDAESEPIDPTKLYVSGLSFRTNEEGLRNAFEQYGQLVEVNLVMDRIANRPRGYAFLRYSTEDESKKAIEGMHGKFLDGRVIFVEICKPRSRVPQRAKRRPLQY